MIKKKEKKFPFQKKKKKNKPYIVTHWHASLNFDKKQSELTWRGHEGWETWRGSAGAWWHHAAWHEWRPWTPGSEWIERWYV
jgi:hypothetical protein